jgi:hypothetical protein
VIVTGSHTDAGPGDLLPGRDLDCGARPLSSNERGDLNRGHLSYSPSVNAFTGGTDVVGSTISTSTPRSRWWDGAIGYEIYIRSFADSDGDGVGDLAGIEARLENIAWLGAEIAWITPFMPSPGFDHGYDVSEYCDIDPVHGTIADFEKVVSRAHELGLRVLVDLVPNHTSSSHVWFRDAISGRDNEHRDWYVWAEPPHRGGPPKKMVSPIGGAPGAHAQAARP